MSRTSRRRMLAERVSDSHYEFEDYAEMMIAKLRILSGDSVLEFPNSRKGGLLDRALYRTLIFPDVPDGMRSIFGFKNNSSVDVRKSGELSYECGLLKRFEDYWRENCYVSDSSNDLSSYALSISRETAEEIVEEFLISGDDGMLDRFGQLVENILFEVDRIKRDSE